MSDDKWSSGQHVSGFNRASSSEAPAPVELETDDGPKTPRAGLHGGPTPPGYLRADVDRMVRETAARDRAFAKLRKIGQTNMNDKKKGLSGHFNERTRDR